MAAKNQSARSGGKKPAAHRGNLKATKREAPGARAPKAEAKARTPKAVAARTKAAARERVKPGTTKAATKVPMKPVEKPKKPARKASPRKPSPSGQALRDVEQSAGALLDETSTLVAQAAERALAAVSGIADTLMDSTAEALAGQILPEAIYPPGDIEDDEALDATPLNGASGWGEGAGSAGPSGRRGENPAARGARGTTDPSSSGDTAMSSAQHDPMDKTPDGASAAAKKRVSLRVVGQPPAGQAAATPAEVTRKPPWPADSPEAPKLSVVIPVYNEEGILEASLRELVAGLRAMGDTFEVIVAENGSRDNTLGILRMLAGEYPELTYLSVGEPNYGKALRQGMMRARGKFVICDEIDLCDLDFYRRALGLLQGDDNLDMVIGSKVMEGAQDDRPLMRHAATLVVNGMLRASLGFHGTDTHGLKAFRRTRLMPVAAQCIVDKDLFASEFVIRAERLKYRTKEIPVRLAEKRKPSVDLIRRVPNVLKNMARLVMVIRFNWQ